MSSSARSQRIENEKQAAPSLVVIVIVAIIVVILVIFLVAWLTSRTTPVKLECTHDSDCGSGKLCRDAACVPAPVCTAPPVKPGNVQAVYDRNAHTATLTWIGAAGATGYRVYRKLEDPAVSKNNYDEVKVIGAPTTSANFTALPVGTNYFVVSSVNTCGESDESAPEATVPSCAVVPTQPPAPSLILDTDECAGPGFAELVTINHIDATGPRPFNIFRGEGQIDIDSYYWFVEAPSMDPEVALACTGTPVAYEVIHVSNADYATLLNPTGPMIATASLTVSWTPVLNAEEYSVNLVYINANSMPIFIGGTVASPATSLTLDTPTGTQLVFAQVIGYRLCDKSLPSNPGYHITPSGP